MNRTRKLSKPAITSVESLESRIAMAADVSATLLPNGTLSIEGTDGSDAIALTVPYGSLATHVISGNREIASFPTSSIRAIQASLLDGRDVLKVDMGGSSLSSVNVDMGRGTVERVDIVRGIVDTINVNATRSVSTSVLLKDTTVRNAAFVSLASGVDTLTVQGCTVNRLDANLGDGKDSLWVRYSVVSQANVKMGGGNDVVGIDASSVVLGGLIDGGAGDDHLSGRTRTGRARVANFEFVN